MTIFWVQDVAQLVGCLSSVQETSVPAQYERRLGD